MKKSSQANSVKVRSIALPSEHGGWGFLLEPVLLGLLVAASWNSALLSLAMLGLFLIHQPLKIAAKDFRKGRRTPRAMLALRFLAGYGLLFVLSFAAVLLRADARFLIPLAVGAILLTIQFYFDLQNRSRHLAPELSGAIALGAIATSITILKKWPDDQAFALWGIVIARVVPSILYVRARLRLEHGQSIARPPVWGMHILALVAVGALAALDVSPYLALLPMAILLGRALWGLSDYRRPARAVMIGVGEIIFGLVTVILVAVGYWTGV